MVGILSMIKKKKKPLDRNTLGLGKTCFLGLKMSASFFAVVPHQRIPRVKRVSVYIHISGWCGSCASEIRMHPIIQLHV